MSKAPYELVTIPGGVQAKINVRGSAVLSSPTINRGTAFTLPEREALGLTGLLPTGVSTLEGQLRRVYASTWNRPTTCGSGSTWPTFGIATRCCSTGC